MSLTILIPIVIHSVTLLIAIAALVVARGAYKTSPRTVVNELLEIMGEFEARLDRNDGKWRKLNANYASLRAEGRTPVREPEDKQDDDEDVDTRMRPGETPQDWKARMRRAMHNGRLKHGSE